MSSREREEAEEKTAPLEKRLKTIERRYDKLLATNEEEYEPYLGIIGEAVETLDNRAQTVANLKEARQREGADWSFLDEELRLIAAKREAFSLAIQVYVDLKAIDRIQ